MSLMFNDILKSNKCPFLTHSFLDLSVSPSLCCNKLGYNIRFLWHICILTIKGIVCILITALEFYHNQKCM